MSSLSQTDLARELASLDAHTIDNRPDVAGSILQSIRLRDLIDEILGDPELLKGVLANSYLHMNGFLKLVIAKGNGRALRLHLWEKSNYVENIETTIHNHRWNISSILVSGKIRSVTYERSDPGRLFSYKYEHSEGKEYFYLEGKSGVRTLSIHELSRGSVYHLRRDVLHRSIADAGALTMLITDTAEVKTTEVLTPIQIAEGERGIVFRRCSLTEDELRGHLQRCAFLAGTACPVPTDSPT